MTVTFTDSTAVITPALGSHRGAVTALTGPVKDWTSTLGTLIRQAPATAAYLAALMVTTATLASSSPHAVHWLVASASTNLHNMTHDPLRVLVVSAFWVQSTPWIWAMAPLLVAVMAPAERLLGTGRTLFVFAAGHLGATALTVAAIGVGVDRGLLPHRLAYALDVGPSYGLVALGALLAIRIAARPLRLAAIGALLFGLATAVILGGDFTDAGHLVAALIGLALSRLVAGTARAPCDSGKTYCEAMVGSLPPAPSGRKSSGHHLPRYGSARCPTMIPATGSRDDRISSMSVRLQERRVSQPANDDRTRRKPSLSVHGPNVLWNSLLMERGSVADFIKVPRRGTNCGCRRDPEIPVLRP
jgi:hypothetical protein